MLGGYPSRSQAADEAGTLTGAVPTASRLSAQARTDDQCVGPICNAVGIRDEDYDQAEQRIIEKGRGGLGMTGLLGCIQFVIDLILSLIVR
jgi:hypothetical protein